MPTDIKVMTYNIQLGAGSDSMARYIYDWLSISLALPHSTKNIETIIETIDAVSPDILAITESENPSVRNRFVNYNQMIQHGIFPINNFGEYAYFPGHYCSTKSGAVAKKNQNNAIFVKPDHRISEESYFDFTKSEQRRCIGRADINVRTENDFLPVSVFVTHLSVSKKYRPQQIEEVVEFTRQAKGLVILMGDFNIKRDEKELNVLRNYFNEAGPLGTWPSWGKPKYPMDRIFVSKEFGVTDVFTPKVSGSDHLPLVAMLRY